MLSEEIIMMELQGDFEHSEAPQFDSLTLGCVKEASKGNFELQIGNHLLKGKSIDLQKPILMTEKQVNEETGDIQYVVRAVIKRKVLFGGRPTPLRLNQGIEGPPTKVRQV